MTKARRTTRGARTATRHDAVTKAVAAAVSVATLIGLVALTHALAEASDPVGGRDSVLGYLVVGVGGLLILAVPAVTSAIVGGDRTSRGRR